MIFSIFLDILYCIAFVFVSPWLLYGMVKKGKYKDSIKARLGFISEFPRLQNCLWVHGVSVGEIKAAQPLVSELKRSFPDRKILLTSTSSNGIKIAKELYKECLVVPFPMDFSWSILKYFRHFSPSLIILMELELWPNFLYWAARKNIPVMLFNGRLSEKSFKGYSFWFGRLFNRMTKAVKHFAVQNELYANRFEKLGIPKEKICITGNMKFDAVFTEKNSLKKEELLKSLGTMDFPVLVAGSTHAPEESILLSSYSELLSSFPDLRMILVPRDPQRAEEIAQWARQKQFTVTKRTQIQEGFFFSPKHVLIVDTIGELSILYSLAHVVFIGGSLIPHGGQNFIEPAFLGKAVVCGPYMHNFPDIRIFLEESALVQLENTQNLTKTLGLLLQDKEWNKSLGIKAQKIVQKSQGCTKKNIDLCLEILKK
ncbi:MAG: 3-deoxy-D-manno-octulosonic acid transferase [Candidatus Brocadiae bacterium]|nr:3-deoxy-D-manno-octulosonic acid transferase [Candidatus Brocadiia bacterium]